MDIETLKKQREAYMNDLQLSATNIQRLQGAIAALDRLIADAALELDVEGDKAA